LKEKASRGEITLLLILWDVKKDTMKIMIEATKKIL